MSSVPRYVGGCHCGALRFEVEGPIEGVEECNCSICTRSAYLHWCVAPERFRLFTSMDAVATYEFGTRVAKHHFCRTCGISPFRRARSNPDEVDVNVRCVEGVDLDALPVKRFDGRNWELQMEDRDAAPARPSRPQTAGIGHAEAGRSTLALDLEVPRVDAAPVLSTRARAAFAAVGFVEGLLWLWADGPGTVSAGRAFLLGSVSVSLLAGRALWLPERSGRALLVGAGLGLLVGGLAWRVWSWLPPPDAPYQGDSQRLPAFCLSAFALVLVAVSLAQGRVRVERDRVGDLPERIVANLFVGTVALVFAGGAWLLLFLFAALFELVGVAAPQQVIESRPFAYLATFTAFGYGLSLGRSSAALFESLRRLAVGAAQVLLPVVSLLTLAFLLVLPATGVAPLWKTGSATPLILSLMALLALLVNALLLDDRPEPGERPAWLRALVSAAVAALPFYAALAGYATWLRIHQHGLTPERVFAVASVACAALYALGAAGGLLAWRSGEWMAWLRPVNLGAALFACGLVLVLFLPPGDPWRLSATNQLARLRRGDVAPQGFDYGALRFHLGGYGWSRLAELERDPGPQRDVVIARIAEVLAAESYRGPQDSPALDVANLRFRHIPRDVVLPDDLLAKLGGLVPFLASACTIAEACAVLAADLGGDDAPEFCILGAWRYESVCVEKRAGFWVDVGKLQPLGFPTDTDWNEIVRLLEQHARRVEPGYFRSIVVEGKGRLEIVPH